MGAYPRVVDFNDDGKKDLLAGDQDGCVWIFINTGSDAAPMLVAGRKLKAGGKVIKGSQRIYEMVDDNYRVKETIPGNSPLAEKYSKLDFADFNDDGLKDLLMGHSYQHFLVYYNTGEKGNPVFGPPGVIKPEKDAFPSRPSPLVVDWNKDGKKDLLVGGERGQIYFYPNEGTNKKPRFVKGHKMTVGGKEIVQGIRARFDVTDWNNDGKLDLLVGNYYYDRTGETRVSGGNIWLYLR